MGGGGGAVTGTTDAAQAERIAAAMRAARADEVGAYLTRARARRPPMRGVAGARRTVDQSSSHAHAHTRTHSESVFIWCRRLPWRASMSASAHAQFHARSHGCVDALRLWH